MTYSNPSKKSPVAKKNLKPSNSERLRRVLAQLNSALQIRRKKQKHVTVIVNPAAGQSSPDLHAINRVMRAAGWTWNIEITDTFGDGARFARRAIRAGASVIAVYGGDGTLMDVAEGLVSSDVPMAILPGGTGNTLARELSIPFDMATACAMIVEPEPCIRPIDLGQAKNLEHYFIQRLGVGLEALVVQFADRTTKDRLGLLAYLSAVVQAWSLAPVSHYRLEVDGSPVLVDGLACMVANAGALGIAGIAISPEVAIDDGMLDVFIIQRADINELASLAATMVGATSPTVSTLAHWKCRTLRVEADPPQDVEADGEALGRTPVELSVLPKAINVIVPRMG